MMSVDLRRGVGGGFIPDNKPGGPITEKWRREGAGVAVGLL